MSESKPTKVETIKPSLISWNPAEKNKPLGAVPRTTSEQIRSYLRAARQAANDWRKTAVAERALLLTPLADQLSARREELAILQAREVGKPIEESYLEIEDSISYFQWYLDNCRELLSPRTTHSDNQSLHSIFFEPLGVAAVIVPWNFPICNFIWGVIPNLIAGNTVIFKHSEECLLMGKVLEEMVASCNLPGGVFAEVYGEAGEGAELISADVDLVWFTGSTSTGRTIQQQTGPRFIKTVLELGGSAPGIVCEDADIEQAAESIYLARFTNCGQVCDGLKRLIVHESIVNELLVKLTTILSSKVVGDPQLPTTDLGPLVSEGQLARLLAQMEDAKSKGAEVITGGYQPDLQGYYYVPTLLTNISKDMTIWREETFGPVLPIVTFRDDTQAAQLANDTDYGLGAYIYSGNVERATQLAQQIETGMVAINSAYYLLPCNPFGGSKATGGGRAHGPFAFHEICNQKVIARPICR